MIQGTVTDQREAIVSLELLDAQGQPQSLSVVVDTGYTGWLTLPPEYIAKWGLVFIRFGRATLADGSKIAFNVYEATLLWDGQPLSIVVDAVDAEPLLGMSLMQGYKLTVEGIAGGAVTLARMEQP